MTVPVTAHERTHPSADGPHDVAIIGAGFSGIAAGHQMEQLGIPYTIYERRHEVGGVWSINKYPDARVDTVMLPVSDGLTLLRRV